MGRKGFRGDDKEPLDTSITKTPAAAAILKKAENYGHVERAEAIERELADDSGIFAYGNWNREQRISQVNIDTFYELDEHLTKIGEGTKNLRYSYIYILGAAAANIIGGKQEIQLTERYLKKLFATLAADPQSIKDML